MKQILFLDDVQSVIEMINYLETWPTVEEIRQPLQAQPDRLIDSGQGRQSRIPVAISGVSINSPGMELT